MGLGARLKPGSNTPLYSCDITNGLFHFEVWFSDMNIMSAMSKRKPHDIKFKFKSIECAKTITKEAANNIVLYSNGNRD